VQHQSPATTPDEVNLQPTQYEPLACVTDPKLPSCLQMASRGSALVDANQPQVVVLGEVLEVLQVERGQR
jgi:hypothetical protein